eukprot:CAMPEP_0195641004 /NCGR_PEP_ID=MMETSP0815-20121206/26463_1 /TAXON_ID=97485 /ORGANISM="Prymnesium parvum, Strain Texoma1" /LENGTH=109 /DNA_ID=CAMNT_0040783735 /DNA_START=144 /DNA_END=469 /DNA_ORIENTATION=+
MPRSGPHGTLVSIVAPMELLVKSLHARRTAVYPSHDSSLTPPSGRGHSITTTAPLNGQAAASGTRRASGVPRAPTTGGGRRRGGVCPPSRRRLTPSWAARRRGCRQSRT